MKKRIEISHADLFRSMANMIATSKRVTMAIAKSRKEPSFFYTIGNQEKQLPELLIIGNFKPQDMCSILNTLSDAMAEAKEPAKDGSTIDLGGEYPLLIYLASKDAKEKYTVQAGQFYANEDYEVMQVVIPDKKGCYPPDPKCHKDYQVPVLRESKDGIPTRGVEHH
jgi:hypothetical protein